MRRWAWMAMLLALGARAQGMVPGGLPAGRLAAKVGEWVTYRLDGGPGRASFWRIAVVGEERDNRGRDAVWIEMDFGQSPEMLAPLAQMRLLVARQPGLCAEGVTRLLVAQGVDRPREVSSEAIPSLMGRLPQALPAPIGGAGPLRVREGATARLMTAAGTLSARPVELVLGGRTLRRLWLSAEVPVLGLARLELPGLGQTMEVADHGLDAKPRMALPAPAAPQLQLER